jgi:hypothetical protein
MGPEESTAKVCDDAYHKYSSCFRASYRCVLGVGRGALRSRGGEQVRCLTVMEERGPQMPEQGVQTVGGVVQTLERGDNGCRIQARNLFQCKAQCWRRIKVSLAEHG